MHIFGQPPKGETRRKDRVFAYTRERSQSTLDVWISDRAVSVGPRDRNAAGYTDAVDAARGMGFTVVERRLGGRPVAMHPSTLAFLWGIPIGSSGVRERYRHVQSAVRDAVATVGVDARAGEPPDSFCPGSYGLSADGKIAGFAQRVHEDVAIVGGMLILDAPEQIATVLEAVYRALELPFDPTSVGSIASSGGESDPARTQAALIEAFTNRTF